MGKAKTLWAQRKRWELLEMLGRRCRLCGCKECLTFDCIVPRGGLHHRLSSADRMTFYCREARLGNLQVLCFDCNVKKSAHPQARYLPAVSPLVVLDFP